VHRTYYSGAERGIRNVFLANIEKIAKDLGKVCLICLVNSVSSQGVRRTSEKNEPAPNAERDSLGAAPRAEFAENRRHVKFDGVFRDREP
jgi:hypothetical protein